MQMGLLASRNVQVRNAVEEWYRLKNCSQLSWLSNSSANGRGEEMNVFGKSLDILFGSNIHKFLLIGPALIWYFWTPESVESKLSNLEQGEN